MRKHSITAQLSRTARRVSTVLAPSLTKIEPVYSLQRHGILRIRIVDASKLQNAMESYVVHNAVNFEPVDFEIIDGTTEEVVLRAQLFAEELVILDGLKRLISVVLADPESSSIAKIRHPVTGIKIFEIVDTGDSDFWHIMACVEETNKCQVYPNSNLCSDNSMTVEFSENSDSEMRLLILCFGIVQIIKKGYPALWTIIQEYQHRTHS